jgi:lipid-A-disaccharide synthase-like uncharacterized protein
VTPGRTTGVFLVVALLLVGAETAWSADRMEIRVKPPPDGVRKVLLISTDDGPRYELELADGESRVVTPTELAELLERDYEGRRAVFRFLNITSWAGVGWVIMGLLAQGVFAGRMIVQWLASEKAGQSIVPPVFWWMSLAGASMLITYFIWRRDIVGVIGQSTGWTIYLRNLWFIYRPKAKDQSAS